jgi:hypothetical protein
VDEEVGGLDPLPRAREAGGLGDVALVQLVPGGRQVGGAPAVADQAAGALALRGERGGEAAADEAGGAGDEGARGDGPRLPRPPPP